MSTSPCPGVTIRELPDSGIRVIRVHYTADPTMTPERVAQLRSKYPSEALWKRELEIEYEAMSGERMFGEYTPEYNDCDPFDVSNPEHWSIYHACDPHGRTQNMFAWVAVNCEGDEVACGELWPKGEHKATVRECAEAIEWIESDSDEKPMAFAWADGKQLKIRYRVMDTHGLAANSDEGEDFFRSFRDHGISYQPAKKGELGVATDSIRNLLQPAQMIVGNKTWMQARYRIFRPCTEIRAEFINVRYPEGEVGRPSDEKPVTFRKHGLDCLLYIQCEKPRFVDPKPRAQNIDPIYANTAY